MEYRTVRNTKCSRLICMLMLLVLVLCSAERATAESKGFGVSRASVRMHDIFHNESDQVDANRGTLPASYSSVKKKYVTPVKNQGAYGTCSYYATIAAIESSAIRNGLRKRKGLDLSEYHLFYFFSHRAVDPLKLTKGDVTTVAGDQLVLGGNITFNGFHLLTWSGPAKESKVKFDTDTWRTALKKSLAYKDDLHVQGMLIHPMYDRAGIKQLIMDYGAVAVTYYHSQNYITNGDPEYYNAETGAYCYNGKFDRTTTRYGVSAGERYYSESAEAYFYNREPATVGNHSLTIVGWNDKYSRKNFPAQNRPERDGAWLARNQWGTGFGNKGYFWISYEDTVMHMNDTYNVNMGMAFQLGSASNYDYNYQYDGGTGTYYANPMDKMTMSNIYKVTGAANQSLEAVGFGTYSDNISYSIQIYRNPKKGKPMSGTKMLKTPQTGTLKSAGFVTVPLKQKISLKKGQTFTVSVTVSSASGNATFLVDQNIPAETFGWVKVAAKQTAGQSFYTWYWPGGSQTIDTTDSWYQYTPRIKAYTKKK